MAPREVRLVCMPWAASTRPSLGIGLLVAAARARGHACRAEYLQLDFAAALGVDVYEQVAVQEDYFALGEHLFAVDLFGARALRSDAFLDRFLALHADEGAGDFQADALYAVRDLLVPDALERYAERLLADEPDVVGFSCVFNQVLPSLALARRLKTAKPDLTILLGGACVHGRMGETYAANFPELVDHVFTGEADATFPAFLDALAAGRKHTALPGVTANGRLRAPAEPVRALDDLPVPDYGDYFREHAAVRARGGRLLDRQDVAFESSRGCWWGEKRHCTFCGLNNEGMAYRMKAPERVVAELTTLATRHGVLDLEAADNILPYTAYRTLLPRLAALEIDFRLMYEIKANIGRDDAAALAGAGIRWVQPGVESFADHVLQLMRKGSTGAQNIQLLKWLQEFGITPYYNILVGFPGETDEDFEQLIALIPSLMHLTPPVRTTSIMVSVHRFAPFFNEPERWGIENVRPAWYYRHLIPPRRAPAEDFAFFFDRDVPPDAPVHRQRARLDEVLTRWGRARRRLTAALGPGFVSVLRAAGGREREIARLGGDAACVFLLCDAQTSETKLARDLATVRPTAVAGLETTVAELVRQGVIVRCGGRLVGVVPFERPHRTADLEAWLARWGPAQPASRTSSTVRSADSKAPSIQPGSTDVWSPAKWSRPSGRVSAGSSDAISPGANQQ